MTLRLQDGIVVLEGVCGVEDSEALLSSLLGGDATRVDVSKAAHLHAAVVQVLLALRPTVTGAPDDPFLRRFIVPAFAAPDHCSPAGAATGHGRL